MDIHLSVTIHLFVYKIFGNFALVDIRSGSNKTRGQTSHSLSEASVLG